MRHSIKLFPFHARGLAAIVALVFASASPAQEKSEITLAIGDAAPALAIGKWVKGEPIKAFEDNKVYVVEFWATWCGPCLAGMPHLSELQAKYADRGVQIIGVNIWDEPEKVQPFLEGEVKMHKKTGDEIMRYTVAIEEKHDPENIRNGRMALDWMIAAGRNGIPSAFIVDQKQRIAWIGHPSQMDSPLEQIVAGKWNIEAAATALAEKNAAQVAYGKYAAAMRKGDYDAAYEIARELVRGAYAKQAMALNSIAWNIVDPDKKPKVQDLELAMEAATRANELTEGKNPMILDTLAMVHFSCDHVEEAVKCQKLAVEYADERLSPDLKKRLVEFESAASAKDADGGKKTQDRQPKPKSL